MPMMAARHPKETINPVAVLAIFLEKRSAGRDVKSTSGSQIKSPMKTRGTRRKEKGGWNEETAEKAASKNISIMIGRLLFPPK